MTLAPAEAVAAKGSISKIEEVNLTDEERKAKWKAMCDAVGRRTRVEVNP
jgi:hypothetical protein